jgi:hypothetical protein
MDLEGKNCFPLPFLHGWWKVSGDGSSIGIVVFCLNAALVATSDAMGC